MDINLQTGDPVEDFNKKEFSAFNPDEHKKPKQAHRELPKEVMNFFMDKGYTKESAAAITARLVQESKLNPGIKEKGNTADSFGIAQWRKERLSGLGKFHNKDPYETNMQEQLQYMDHELNNKYSKTRDKIKGSTNIAQSWEDFTKGYERPKDWQFKQAEQIANAEKLHAGKFISLKGDAQKEETKIEKATKKIKQSFAEVNPTALGVGGAILGTVAASSIAPKTSSASMFNSVASGSARVENQQLPTINEPSTRTASTAPVIKENGAIDINATRMRQETLNFQTKVLKYLKNIADKLTNGRGSFDFGSNSDERSSIFSGKNNLGGNIGAALGNLAAPVLGTLGVAGGAFLGNLAGGAVGMAARGTMALGGAVASGIAGTSALGVLGPIGAAAAGGYALYQGIQKQREIRLETDPKKKQALKDKLDWYNKPIVEFDSNKVPRALYNGQQHLKRGLYSGQEKIKEVGGEALDYTKGILESIKKSINAKGKELEKGIDNTITSMKETISQTILGIGTSISNAIKGAVDGAINAIKAPFTPTQAEQNKLQGKTSEGVKVDQGNKSNPAPQPDNIPRDKSGRPINAPANTPIDKSGRPINAPANTPIDKSGRPINAPKIVPASSAIIPKATSQTTEQLTVAHQAANNLIQKKEDSSPTIINNYNSTTSNKDGSGGDTTSRIFVTNRDSTQMGLQFISNISGAGALQQ